MRVEMPSRLPRLDGIQRLDNINRGAISDFCEQVHHRLDKCSDEGQGRSQSRLV